MSATAKQLESAQETASTEEVSHEITLFAEPVFHIGGFTVTNSLLSSWLVVVLIIIFSVTIRKNIKKIPNRLQTVLELVLEEALKLCDQVTGERKLSKKVFPVAISIFFFVLLNNWLGILPGVGSIGFIEEVEGHKAFIPLLRGATADINTTMALALISVIGANVFGVLSIGLWKTFNKYFNFAGLAAIPRKIMKDPTIIVVAPITFVVGLIELVGELAKVASLSFRLFGNVFAGEVLLASMSALLAVGIPIPFIFLEILVGVIQAMIFAMLTLVYFTIAAQDHSEHEDEHGSAESHEAAAAH